MNIVTVLSYVVLFTLYFYFSYNYDNRRLHKNVWKSAIIEKYCQSILGRNTPVYVGPQLDFAYATPKGTIVVPRTFFMLPPYVQRKVLLHEQYHIDHKHPLYTVSLKALFMTLASALIIQGNILEIEVGLLVLVVAYTLIDRFIHKIFEEKTDKATGTDRLFEPEPD